MAVSAKADKTYSFRAPQAFGEQMRDAREALPAILADPAASDHFTREFEVALLRRLRDLPTTSGQAEFARAVTESLVVTAKRTRREPELIEQLRAFAREDAEGDVWRQGALRAFSREVDDE
jgi:antitoxin component of MazEF toxin-antitoxin module